MFLQVTSNFNLHNSKLFPWEVGSYVPEMRLITECYYNFYVNYENSPTLYLHFAIKYTMYSLVHKTVVYLPFLLHGEGFSPQQICV
jgi:hypothetical protein